MDIKRYTEAEVLEDYRTGMQMLADQLVLLVGKQAAAGVAGLTEEQMDDVNPGFSASHQILESDGADLLRQAYQFAYLGKLSGWLADELNDNAIGRWESMFMGMKRIASANWGGQPFEKCLQTIRVAKLRVCLMPETYVYSRAKAGDELVKGCLHLSELAILSGLEEKTLRNMGSASHKQHLPTTKIGPKTYVKLTVAVPWLEARGFASIVFDEAPARRDLNANPFYSKADLASFVRRRREELVISNEQLEQKLSATPELLKAIYDIERATAVADPTLLTDLAAVLEISDPNAFVKAVGHIDGILSSSI